MGGRADKVISVLLVTGGPSILVYTTFVYLGRGSLPSVTGSIVRIYGELLPLPLSP